MQTKTQKRKAGGQLPASRKKMSKATQQATYEELLPTLTDKNLAGLTKEYMDDCIANNKKNGLHNLRAVAKLSDSFFRFFQPDINVTIRGILAANRHMGSNLKSLDKHHRSLNDYGFKSELLAGLAAHADGAKYIDAMAGLIAHVKKQGYRKERFLEQLENASEQIRKPYKKVDWQARVLKKEEYAHRKQLGPSLRTYYIFCEHLISLVNQDLVAESKPRFSKEIPHPGKTSGHKKEAKKHSVVRLAASSSVEASQQPTAATPHQHELNSLTRLLEFAERNNRSSVLQSTTSLYAASSSSWTPALFSPTPRQTAFTHDLADPAPIPTSTAAPADSLDQALVPQTLEDVTDADLEVLGAGGMALQS